MSTGLKQVAAEIRLARQAKALTQRELGERVGLPQSHISKIEGGRVDLQLSSLTEIARALDLEVKLVPRKAVPAVEGAVRAHATTVETSRALATLAEQAEFAKRLKLEFPQLPQVWRFQEAIQNIPSIQFDAASLKALNDALKPVVELHGPSLKGVRVADLVKRISSANFRLQNFRNLLAHHPLEDAPRPLPAYRLEEDGE